jgi:hypothetical protein
MQGMLAISQCRILFSSLLSTNTKIQIYRTKILPVVLHGHEIWSLTLRENHRLRVFENRVLRRMLGTERNKVIRERRRMINKELHDLYSSLNFLQVVKSTQMRQVRHGAGMGRGEVHTGFWLETSGKRSLGKPRHRWEDNIKMDLQGTGWGHGQD